MKTIALFWYDTLYPWMESANKWEVGIGEIVDTGTDRQSLILNFISGTFQDLDPFCVSVFKFEQPISH